MRSPYMIKSQYLQYGDGGPQIYKNMGTWGPWNRGSLTRHVTTGHFLIGKPVEAIPDPDLPDHPVSSLRRWNLCQTLVKHFWQRWSSEYLVTLQKLSKWQHPSRNFIVGVRVVDLKTSGLGRREVQVDFLWLVKGCHLYMWDHFQILRNLLSIANDKMVMIIATST